MELGSILVQCLTDEDRTQAQRTMEQHGPVSWSGAYARGVATEEDAVRLERSGLVVEWLPQTPTLSWLDESEQATPQPDLLAASEDLGPPSPLRTLSASVPEVYLLQLKAPIQPEWRERLIALGVNLRGYVPDFAFKAALTEQQKRAVEDLEFVVRVVWYSPRHTLRRLTTTKQQASRTRRDPAATQEPTPFSPAAESARYEVKCHNPRDLPALLDALQQDPRARDVEAGRHRIRFTCGKDSPLLGKLAKMPQVSVVDFYRAPELDNEFVRRVVGVESGAPPVLLPWDGTGVIVGVADSGVDESHDDLVNRIIRPVIERVPPAGPNDPNGHGTHVSGTIAGDGAASAGAIRGIAPATRLVVQSLRDAAGELSGVPINLGDLFQEAYDRGVRIHNNSWGADAHGLYTIDSFEVDEFVYNHPDFLVVFAVGNTGQQPDPVDPPGRIGLMSLQSPASAKNALTVGACCSPRSDGPFHGMTWRQYPGRLAPPQHPLVADEFICGDESVLAAFSSRGPVDDARVKPDLVAPGTAILSASSASSTARFPHAAHGGKYAFLSGTSMAAPAVSGAAAVVRQYYVQAHNHQPSAALLKATLINGTDWIDRKTALDEHVGRPNFHQGFGRVNLRCPLPVPGDPWRPGFALRFADVDRQSADALNRSDSTRNTWRRSVEVGSGQPMRVTLAWTDRPAHGLQQDLDLTVVTPNGKRIVGNPDLVRETWAKTDHRNNVEHITLEAPMPGTYRIIVLAYNTPFENQGFSLVVTGELRSGLMP